MHQSNEQPLAQPSANVEATALVVEEEIKHKYVNKEVGVGDIVYVGRRYTRPYLVTRVGYGDCAQEVRLVRLDKDISKWSVGVWT